MVLQGNTIGNEVTASRSTAKVARQAREIGGSPATWGLVRDDLVSKEPPSGAGRATSRGLQESELRSAT